MSWPSACSKKLSPERKTIAENHGSTSSSIQTTPVNGPQRQNPACRAVEDRQRDGGQPDEHQDQRPLDQHAGGHRRPQNRRQSPAGRRAPARGAAQDRCAPWRPWPRPNRQAAPRRSWRAAPRRRARSSLPSSAQRAAWRGGRQRRAPPNRSAARRRSRRRATAGGRARWWCARVARRARRQLSPRRPAASRCRPASCSAPRPGNGCRHSRRSPPSAWWPAQSAPRRGRPAGCWKKPGRKAIRQKTMSNAAARPCEAQATSITAERPRAGTIDCRASLAVMLIDQMIPRAPPHINTAAIRH